MKTIKKRKFSLVTSLKSCFEVQFDNCSECFISHENIGYKDFNIDVDNFIYKNIDILRKVLIISNGKYESGILIEAVNNARNFSNSLKKREIDNRTYAIALEMNLTYKDMLRAFYQFAASIQPNDHVFIYK
eukprot:GHVL01007250.1.p1 GENE.GHVL01007250.1~~GHVL01007250.1.p1  ORF type:complete len:131 (-),score=30.71 GHVL01007250.1:138-530(-)